MKATVAISAILAALIFTWYLVADRITPFTSNVRVKAMVIDIVPEVSGKVAAVAVSNGQVVERGDLLAQIDPRPFQLKVDRRARGARPRHSERRRRIGRDRGLGREPRRRAHQSQECRGPDKAYA